MTPTKQSVGRHCRQHLGHSVRQATDSNTDHPVESHDETHNNNNNNNNNNDSSSSRRALFQTATTAALTAVTMTATSSSFSNSAANAYTYGQAFPTYLDNVDGDMTRDIRSVRQRATDAKRQKRDEYMDYVTESNPLFFRNKKDVATVTAWGGALWLLSGSRSNPLVTPLANLLFDPSEEEWLRDRNDGLFASIPWSLSVVLVVIFFLLGILTDRLVLLLAEGSANVSLQLAGVSLIGGATLELGRVASGEKVMDRADYDRTMMLTQEFADFADERLKKGGNCHRNEVVKAFRRYNAKYRQAESEDYPLTDLEIEQLLKNWNAMTRSAEMSSSGFYQGISINSGADVFVER